MIGTALSTMIAGNSLLSWLLAFGLALAAGSTIYLAKEALRSRLTRLTRRTANGWDDHLVDVIGRTNVVFCVAMGLLAGLAPLDLGPAGPWAWKALLVVTLVQAGLWAGASVRYAVTRFALSRNDPAVGGAVGIIRVMVNVALWSVIGLLILASLGVDVTAGVAGLGIGGVAVALAVQNVLGDLFASLSIVLDRPFVVGDYVTVGEDGGTVEQIGLKTTRLRSLTGETLVFSNSELLKARIRNFREMEERRALLQIGLPYETPRESIHDVVSVLQEVVRSQAGVRLARAHFKAFGPSSLDFEVVYFVLSPDYDRFMDAQQAVNLGVLDAFAARGLGFAYPTRTLWVRDGDRPLSDP